MYMSNCARRCLCFLIVVAALWSCGGDGADSGDASGDAVADSTATDSTRTDSARTDSVQGDSLEPDSATTDSTEADSAKVTIDAIPVEAVAANAGTISSYLIFNSTVETEAAVEVYPQASGLVEAVLVEEGDRVAAGDVLVRIDDDELRLTADEAGVNLQHLERGFKRIGEMFKRHLISNQEFENKEYELNQARLRWDQAQLNLAHATIRAPFSGVITERLVQVGARVGGSAKLLELIKLDDMVARVYVPGQYLTTVRENQLAVITSDFLAGREFGGWVKRISPVVDPRSGTFKVTVGLRDRWEYLRPGIFVSLRIVTDTHQNAVLVPKQAIVYDGGERYIFVVEDSTATRVLLNAGYENGTHIEALTDVAVGQPVIVVGQTGLKDQTRVKIVGRAEDLDAAADTLAARG
jgi:membrane fusion protein, multidrug efflux system